jgi:protoporphyrin/coproporphyrin ferrochelatase
MMKENQIIGVLLMAYGSPDTPEDIEPYYTHIRHGRAPSAELLEELQGRYRLVGGRTPLADISEATRSLLEKRLNAESENRYRVILGMKHWHPYIEQAVREMASEGIHRAVGLILAPHYSTRSVAEYYGYVEEAQRTLGTSIELERIDRWHLFPPFLEAVRCRIEAQLKQFPTGAEVTVVFTAHSLPEKILESGDPYPTQLMETSRALVDMVGIPSWTFSYQSAGRTPDPWLGPDLVETVRRLAREGVKNILVASIGFVSDHLEILYDIDYEAQEAARDEGITLRRTEMLNASVDFVEGLVALVRERVGDVEDAIPT